MGDTNEFMEVLNSIPGGGNGLPVETSPDSPAEQPKPETPPLSQTDTAPQGDAAVANPTMPETPPAAAGGVQPTQEVSVEPTIEEELRAEIARLSGLVTAGQLDAGTQQVYPPDAGGTPVVPAVPQVATSPKDDPLVAIQAALTQGFLTAEELDAVIDRPELLNEAYKRSSTSLLQNLVRLIPTIVNQTVSMEIQKNKLVTTFYELYPDLKPYGDFVRLNMAEQEKMNPQRTYKEIFEETAKVSRKRLGFKESPTGVVVGVQPDGKKLPPAFAGSRDSGGKVPVKPAGTNELFDSNASDLLSLIGKL